MTEVQFYIVLLILLVCIYIYLVGIVNFIFFIIGASISLFIIDLIKKVVVKDKQ